MMERTQQPERPKSERLEIEYKNVRNSALFGFRHYSDFGIPLYLITVRFEN